MTLPTIGTKVRVHKNLHRGDWSITVKGKVVAHVPELVLANVTFKIREIARQRVIARRCREVHAWAEGDLVACTPAALAMQPIGYNPYAAPTFIARDTGAAVTACEFVHFGAAGAVAIGEVQG